MGHRIVSHLRVLVMPFIISYLFLIKNLELIITLEFLCCRLLSKTQKDLLLAYAETDSSVDGTVNGITDTKTGV